MLFWFGTRQGFWKLNFTRSSQNLGSCPPGNVVYPKWAFITRLSRTWPHPSTKHVTHHIMTGENRILGIWSRWMNIQSNRLSSSERKALLINSTLLQPWLRSFLPVTKMEISQFRSRYSRWEVILEYSIVTIIFGCLLVLTWSAKLLRTAQNGWNLDWPRKLNWECGILVRVNGANNEEKKILLCEIFDF